MNLFETRGAENWVTTRRFAVVLGLLVVAAFPEVLLGLKTFLHRDFGLFGYPLAHYHKDCFWRGELPLWNPYNNAGVPFLAQWNALVLYPGSLIYLLFPLPWSLNAFCLAHLFLAGLGMYRLAERWTHHRLAAAIAGTAFAFNGLTLNALMWPNNIAALGWMPWVVWLVEDGWREGGRRQVRGIVAGALQMLAGAPEITLFTWLLLGAIWIGNWMRRVRPPRVWIQRGFVSVVLVGGVAAAQMIPFVDLLWHSHRDKAFSTGAWAMPAWGWANFLVPGFRMIRSGSGLHFQPDQFWTSSYYLPLGVTALAVWAAIRMRQPRVWLLATALLASLVLALGDSGLVYRWLREGFPAANFMRFPIKFVILAVFVVPLLAALALPRNREFPPRHQRAARPFPRLLGWSVSVGIVGILLWAKFAPLAGTDWKVAWQSGWSRLGLLAAFLAALKWALTSARLPPWLGATLVLSLVWFDALTHTAWQNPTGTPAVFGPEPALARGMTSPPVLGQSRALLSLASMDAFYRRNSTNAAETLAARRLALLNDLNLLERVPKVDGFLSLYLPEERALHYRLYATDTEVRAGLADFLGASQVTCASNVLAWTARPTALPWVTAGQQPAFLDRASTITWLTGKEFNPREVVALPPEAARVVPSRRVNARVIATSWSSHRVSAEVEASAPTVVVFSQAHYHPWQARVDGASANIWRANLAFQAVAVPAGRHRVELVYRDWAFILGLLVSGASGLVVMGMWRRGRARALEGQPCLPTVEFDLQKAV